MEKEFVTVDQAIELKALGFSERCFSFYSKDSAVLYFDVDPDDRTLEWHDQSSVEIRNFSWVSRTSAPLRQQVFRWFRDEQNILGSIDFCKRNNWYYIIRDIVSLKDTLIDSVSEGDYKSYEEAESSCIDKLIEIVKNK